MQALARRRQGAFLVGHPTARRLGALAVLPGRAALFAASLLVRVLRGGGTALAVELALPAPFWCAPGGKRGANQAQPCISLLGHDGQGGGAQIQSDRPLSRGVLGFL